MTVSIFHRATGSAMATLGSLLLVAWLACAAAGAEAYARFTGLFTTASGNLNIVGWVLGVGFTWALFQHMASGIRHLVMDTGAAFELKVNRAAAIATFVFSVIATIAYWLILGFN